MSRRHRLDRDEVDLAQLRRELSARLGRRVELVAADPVGREPGVVIVEDPDTAERLDVDPTLVAEAIAATGTVRSRDRRALEDLDAVGSAPEKLAVLRDWLAARVASEDEATEKRREIRRLARQDGPSRGGSRVSE